MKRRTLIQKAAGFGLLAEFLPNEMMATNVPTQKLTQSPGLEDSHGNDWHGELTKRIAALEQRGGGTLELSDGVYAISQSLRLPTSVSLVMTPNAILRARPGFQGDAVLIKGGGNPSKFSETSGWIRGGIIDGGRQPLTGILVEDVPRLEIADLVVVNATYKGIHLLKGGYEKNITRVRCDVNLKTKYAPGSIGIHYENGDSKVILAHLIGYETGLRSDGDSNWFTLVHVWNYDPVQGPMLHCFYCNGNNDTFNQCYADSPTIAGFHVSQSNQSFMQCRVFYSRWAKDNSGVGFLITPEGKNGNYIGTSLFAQEKHRLAKAFDGNLAGACILGTTYSEVTGGMENQIPSGDASSPVLNLAGTGFRLTQQTAPPMPADGELGEVRWVEDENTSALWVKTSKGWKKSELL